MTNLPPNKLEYKWYFDREKGQSQQALPTKIYDGFSFTVQRANKKNMGKLQCSGKGSLII